ncbi:MAG TPA: porin [Caulobacteraceae bacterium]|jgi:phosphate-selective porin OprO/OprP|nr:porin [Caulobacteraceae bacterium]
MTAGAAAAQDQGAIGSAGAVQAVPTDPVQARIQALEEQLAILQGQISSLKESTSAGIRDVRDAASNQTQATLPNGRPSLASADGRFTANLHGILHFDTAYYAQAEPGPLNQDLRRGGAASDTAHARDLNSGTNFRRARLGFDGKVFGDVDYNFVYEFGGSGAEDAGRIYEASLTYNGLAPWHIKVGSFIPLQGLEDSNSTNGIPLLERPAPSDITRTLVGGDSRTALQFFGYGERWLISGAVTGTSPGVVNSTGSATAQAFDEQLGLIGRVAYTPFKGDDWRVHVGANVGYVARVADTGGPDATTGRYTIQFRERPELRNDTTRLIDTGAIEAQHAYTAGLELAFQKKNVYVQGEAYRFGIERRNSALSNPNFKAWYVEGSWLITGETRRYNTATAAFDGPPVANPFNGKDKWGAWELAARYSDTDLNYHAGSLGQAPAADAVRGGEQKIWSAGLNWYWNPDVRFMFDIQDVKVQRLSPNAATYATPVGAEIGQHYQAVAVRSQLAF